jgi:tetratricopeptide (TPR) repeat protein
MKRLIVLLILVIPVLTNAQTNTVNIDLQDNALQERHFSYIQKLMDPTGDVMLEIVGKYSPDQLYSHRINQLLQFSQNYPMSSRTSQILTMLADLYEENSQLTHSFAVHLKQIAFFPGTANYTNSVLKIEELVANNNDLMKFKPTIDLYLRGNPVQTSYQQSLYRYLYMLHQITQPEIANMALNEMRQYIRDFPTAADAARIYLWMGNIHRSVENYPESLLSYKRAAELYPESLAAPEALLQSAVLLKEEFNVPDQTLNLLQSIVESNRFRV